MAKKKTPITPQEKKKAEAQLVFLKNLQKTGNVSASARLAGVAPASAYRWRDLDPEKFGLLWKDAVDEAIDSLEAEAWRRAVEGYEKPVTHEGRVTDSFKAYSDSLLQLLLRGHLPHKYKERSQFEMTGPGGGPLETITRIERVIVDPSTDA